MVEGLAHPVVRLLVELGDADVADVPLLHMGAHRLNMDDLANDRELFEIMGRSALDGQLHRRFGRTAHLVDRFPQGKTLDGRVVDARDQISRQHARARRGRIVDRAHDLDQAVLHHHLEAKAAEFLALHAGLEVLESLGVEIVRMRVERRQHAVDRRLDHFLVVRLLGIVVAHFVEHFGEERELFVRARGGGAQHAVGGADQDNAGRDSIRQVGETFLHRETLGSPHQFGLAGAVWPGSEGVADAAGAAGGSVFTGAASAFTAGSGYLTPWRRSIAAISWLSFFSSGGT